MANYTSPSQPEPVVPSAPGSTAPATKRGLRISPKAIAAIVILGLALWFVFANTQDAKIRLWLWTVEGPVWIVLLCTLVVGIIVGWLVGRRRRRVVV